LVISDAFGSPYFVEETGRFTEENPFGPQTKNELDESTMFKGYEIVGDIVAWVDR